MKKNLLKLLLVGTSVLTLAGCGGGGTSTPTSNPGTSTKPSDTPSVSVDPYAGLTGTALAVAKASNMTEAELEAASKEEMEASKSTFKVLGLTSALQKAATQLSAKYEWINYENAGDSNDKYAVTEKSNVYVNNGYKDNTLLEALKPAKDGYVADFALTQDARSIADYKASGILLNYVPSDLASFGVDAKGADPLEGIHFNKVFWTNSNFTNVTGKTLHNIWQLAGTSADKDHIDKVSFQNPATEQINKSFLLSVEAPGNQARIEAAYKSYYGKDWKSNGTYENCGEQWVAEFIANISRLHSSDGTAMKETQLKDDWTAGYVYFGAYSKMKDAAEKYYAVSGQDTDPILKNLIETSGDNAGKIQAMKTVKWDWEIEGFNGFFYTMYSQIVKNAEHPYTACLFARYMLNPDFYKNTIYNKLNPDKDGNKGNQYGYYYPGDMPEFGTAGAKVTTNGYDWTKAKWKEKSLCEDFDYLKDVDTLASLAIETWIQENTKVSK